jgi:hypothetical protein
VVDWRAGARGSSWAAIEASPAAPTPMLTVHAPHLLSFLFFFFSAPPQGNDSILLIFPLLSSLSSKLPNILYNILHIV